MRPRPTVLLVTGGLAFIILTMVIAVGISGQSTRPVVVAPTLAPDQVLPAGERIYQTRCASCHGPDLGGQPGWNQTTGSGPFPAPPLNATSPAALRPEAYLRAVILNGGQSVAPQGYLSGMPAFNQTLSQTEVDAVIAFLKSRWR